MHHDIGGDTRHGTNCGTRHDTSRDTHKLGGHVTDRRYKTIQRLPKSSTFSHMIFDRAVRHGLKFHPTSYGGVLGV